MWIILSIFLTVELRTRLEHKSTVTNPYFVHVGNVFCEIVISLFKQ